MDYTDCPSMFTDGQKTRALTALNSSVGYRNNLWSSANINSMGQTNRFMCVVYINSIQHKDFYYTTPIDKHTSKTTNKGERLHSLLGILFL